MSKSKGGAPAGSGRQLVFNFEPGLTEVYRSLRAIVAQSAYDHGVTRLAGVLNMSPGNFSVALADPGARKLDIDDLVALVAETKDMRPIQWLVQTCMGRAHDSRTVAADRVAFLSAELSKATRELLACEGVA
jgi:hypothetical protein